MSTMAEVLEAMEEATEEAAARRAEEVTVAARRAEEVTAAARRVGGGAAHREATMTGAPPRASRYFEIFRV